MGLSFHYPFKRTSWKLPVFLLSLFWIIGILIGFLLAFAFRRDSVLLISGIGNYKASFFGLAFILLMPLLVLYVFLKTSKAAYIFIFVVFKGIVLGYSIVIMTLCYGNAAWLLHFLCSFSDTMTLAPFFYVLIHLLNVEERTSTRSRSLFLFYALSIGLIDYFLISPSVLTL